jgi:hypothetical protein
MDVQEENKKSVVATLDVEHGYAWYEPVKHQQITAFEVSDNTR